MAQRLDDEQVAQYDEVLCQLAEMVEVEARTRPQADEPDLELVVALVKRARLETIVEKAAELGARRVRLVITERTNAALAVRRATLPAVVGEGLVRLGHPVDVLLTLVGAALVVLGVGELSG